MSVLSLRWAWRMAPLCGKPFGSTANKIICFLGIVLGVFLWVSALIPWVLEINIHFTDFFKTLFVLVGGGFLIGATPVAAFPAILLYSSGKKSRTFK